MLKQHNIRLDKPVTDWLAGMVKRSKAALGRKITKEEFVTLAIYVLADSLDSETIINNYNNLAAVHSKGISK